MKLADPLENGEIARRAYGAELRRVVPALLALVLCSCGESGAASFSTQSAELPSPPSPSIAFGEGPQGITQTARVVDVVDGDTIKVEIDGVIYPLRYIGIDSPESSDPHGGPQAFAQEATAANLALVDNATVVLETDVSDTDRFDRLLRYVWLQRGGSWLMVNRELVRVGAAIANAYPPDTKYQDLLESAEVEARGAAVGMWVATPAPIVPLVPPIVTPTPAPAGNCDPSYPTVCIPPPPPDLNCADVAFRRFQVLAPDPHGFDGNHDGVGCESD